EELFLELDHLIAHPMVLEQPQEKVIHAIFQNQLPDFLCMAQSISIDPVDRSIPLGKQKIAFKGKLPIAVPFGTIVDQSGIFFKIRFHLYRVYWDICSLDPLS